MATERLDEIRSRYRDEALQRGVNPRDVDLLLTDVLERPTSFLLAHGETGVDPEPLAALLARRFAGEPLQYIRKRTEFYSREFYVDQRVLIPRPETELLVEAVLARAPRGGRVIDIGSGSGCIAITIEREREDLRVVSVDRSLDALAVATLNRTRLGSHAMFAASDVLTGVRGPFDVIVSNPPYVPLHEYDALADEVRIHEPRLALTPGPRGTEIIERILDESRAKLAADGRVLMEIGYGQEDAVRELARAARFEVETVIPDLAGIPRVVVLSRDGQ